MGAKPTISITVTALNEEDNIAGCLERLDWADEIVVVVDDRTTDDTETIARRYTDKVFVEKWTGQGAHKNKAIEHASGDWIFSLDADERITPELAKEIRAAIASADKNAYAVRRKNLYRGRWIKHGGWWPDWVLRLVKKGSASFNDVLVHDALQPDSEVGRLQNPLEHHSYRTVLDFLDKEKSFVLRSAAERFKRGKKVSWFGVALHTAWAFFYNYVARLGFLDGGPGLLIAFSRASVVFHRYALLIEMHEDALAGRDPLRKVLPPASVPRPGKTGD